MLRNSDEFEVYPLRGSSSLFGRQNVLKGPSRVVRLCVLGIMLPTVLIAVPLYLRYRVYRNQLYPLAVSDMRIVDGRISTTWCQRQIIRVNTSFKAFLLPDVPKISENLEPLSMVRHLSLEDDMKEYWGFYLLRGSIVKVSTCVRWPGASMIVIRGHKHLHECAYIGDNSSEEADEETGNGQSVKVAHRSDGPANRPTEMRRHRPDVQFLRPPPPPPTPLFSSSQQRNVQKITHQNKSLIEHPPETPDENVSDTEGDIKKILDNLQNKTKSIKRDKNRKKTSKNIKMTNTSELFDLDDILRKLEQSGFKKEEIIEKLSRKVDAESENKKISTVQDEVNKRRRHINIFMNELMRTTREDENVGVEEDFHRDGIADHRGIFKDEQVNDMSKSEFWSSFSSSEEALLNCAGLILNLPLSPHHQCSIDLKSEQVEETTLQNTITYKVPLNGYYFFVFNSENEVQRNYLRVQFDLEKAVYDVSRPLAVCTKSKEKEGNGDEKDCALDLQFLSGQKVVLELSKAEDKTLSSRFLKRGSDLENEDGGDEDEFVAESECEPRSALYAFCVIAVPVVFILFAFT